MVELKIDIDDAKINWVHLKTVIEFFSRSSGYPECKLRFLDGKVLSRNSTHHHIILQVAAINEHDIPFMQMLLGSDKRREMLNFARLFSKLPFAEQNVLFEDNYQVNYAATKKLVAIIKEFE